MLEYIKQQIRAQQQAQSTTEVLAADVPNELITEYAHLFQEFDDLTETGTEEGKTRKLGIDIPLEDDVEVESIELDLGTGNVADVPGDATVSNDTITESYATMKTYDKFYEEAAAHVTRLPRESDAAYDKRVSALADQMYNEYCVDAEEIGAFGFTKIPLNDDKVPSKVNVEFGAMGVDSNKTYVTKLNTYFATDEDHNITKKQLDSVKLVQEGAFNNIGESLMAYMESNYDVPAGSNVWDICTPKSLIVPKGNGDTFCVVLEYTNELTNKSEYFGWSRGVQASIDKLEVLLEQYDMNAEAEKMLKNPDVQKQVDDAIDKLFSGMYFGGVKPTEAELKKNREEVKKMAKDKPSIFLSIYAPDKFSELLDDQTKEVVGDSKKIADEMMKRAKAMTKDSLKTATDMAKAEKINMESFINETHYENKDRYIQEAAMAALESHESNKKKLSRFYQEAIDFGTGDAGSDTGDAPAADTAAAEPPAMDAGTGDATATETPAATEGGEAQPAEGDKETAAVNNVSSEIAEKVADTTQAEANGDTDDTITFSDETSIDDSNGPEDMSVSEDETASVDDQLDDLANTGSDDMGDEEGLEESNEMDSDNIDIENMSMEEIISNASDKLKTMPLSELKEFLASHTNEEIQEAFVLTSKNINKEVDIKLREALGILNDNKMNIDKLVSKFKLTGHKLNRTLSKAAKSTKIYSSDEINSIKKLNKALGELMISLKKSNDSSYVSSIKRKIEEFLKQSKIVAAFVEEKMEAPVQESFLLSNINDKITKALIPVKVDMVDLSDKYQAGQLTRGRIIKRYASTDGSTIGGGRTSNTVSWADTTLTGYSKHAKKIDEALKILNKAIRKNADNIELITQIADKLDVISDYIETVIDDKVENKEYVKMIGKLAGEIVKLIDQYIGDDESTNNVVEDEEVTTEKLTEDTPVDDSDGDVEEASFDDEAVEEVPDEGSDETTEEEDE